MRFLFALIALTPLAGFTQTVHPAFLVNDRVSLPIIQPANEGLFSFKGSPTRYGFADKNMKVVIPAVFGYPNSSDPKTASKFYNGRAVVLKGGKWGVIDKTGKELSPFFECEGIQAFNLNTRLYVLSKGKGQLGVVNAEGKEILPFKHDEIELDSNLIVTKTQNFVLGTKDHVLYDATGKALMKADGFEVFQKIEVNRREGVIWATDFTFNYLFDLKLNRLLQLPRVWDPMNKKDDITIDYYFGNAKDYFTKNPTPGDRYMDFVKVTKGRIFFKNSFMDQLGVGKHGMLDFKGNVVMEPRYDNVWGTFDKYDMIQVSNGKGYKNMRYSHIDRNGKEVIQSQPAVSSVSFNPELPSAVAQDSATKLYGVMDRSGKWVVPPTYTELVNTDRFGGFQVKMPNENSTYYMDLTGKNYGKVTPSEEKWDFYNTDGYSIITVPDTATRVSDEYGILSQPIPDCLEFGLFSEGLAPIRAYSTRKVGFVDTSGKVVIPCIYDYAYSFSDGIAVVSNIVNGRVQSGYIDKKGKVILPLQYERISAFNAGHGLIQTATGFSYVDRTGKLKTPPAEFGQQFLEFSSGLAMGGTRNPDGSMTYTYFDNNFKKAFSINALYSGPFKGEVAIVRLPPNTISLIDKKGNKVKDLPPGLQGIDFFAEGMFGVKYNRKWGFMNEKGNMVIQPKYDSVSAFSFYRAAALLDGKWGVIDITGRTELSFSYAQLILGDGGMATCTFTKGGLWGIRDVGSDELFSYLRQPSVFKEGRAIVKGAGRKVIIRTPLAK
jgi:hypothetical protein